MAQIDRANISGVVTDPTGAVVPDALVELTSLDMGVSRDMRTRADGIYRPSVLAGMYLPTVTKDGFQTAVVDCVQLTEAVSHPLPGFPRGLLVAMNGKSRNFLMYRWDELFRDLP